MSTKGTRITHNASNKLTTLVGAATVPTEVETSFSLTYSHRHGPNNRILLAVFRHAPREHLHHRDGTQGSRHSGNTAINLTIEVSRRQGQSHIAAPLMPDYTYTDTHERIHCSRIPERKAMPPPSCGGPAAVERGAVAAETLDRLYGWGWLLGQKPCYTYKSLIF
jgi:hypothetical protein